MSELRQFLIIFDLPSGDHTFRKKVYRLLKRIGARKIQISVWESDNLQELIRIANLIRIVGGKAEIIEKKVVF